MNEQKLNTGKLKLMEILTPTDIDRIIKIAGDEAKKEARNIKDTLSKDITDIKKKQTDVDGKLTKHTQDKDHHKTETDVKAVVKGETDKLKQDNETKIKDGIDKALKGNDMDKKVRETVADCMVRYHQALWAKKGFWTSSITTK